MKAYLFIYHPGPHHEISSQSVHNVLSNGAYRQTNQHYQNHYLVCQDVKTLGHLVNLIEVAVIEHTFHNCWCVVMLHLKDKAM